eukprot:4073846-Pleurochrysis_carterae.AAC.2
MLCKWGHPVATLAVTNGTIRHIHRITEILQIMIQMKDELGHTQLRFWFSYLDDTVITWHQAAVPYHHRRAMFWKEFLLMQLAVAAITIARQIRDMLARWATAGRGRRAVAYKRECVVACAGGSVTINQNEYEQPQTYQTYKQSCMGSMTKRVFNPSDGWNDLQLPKSLRPVAALPAARIPLTRRTG